MKHIQYISTFAAVLFFSLPAWAQSDNYTRVGHFDQVVVGQHIEVTFREGQEEGVYYEFDDIDPDELIIRQRGKRLEVYLAHARNLEKQRKVHHGIVDFREDWYGHGLVKATVVYRELSRVVVKGEEDIVFADPIVEDIFKLKAYGDMDIVFTRIQAEKFKGKLYGENDIEFEEGAIGLQKYKLFGENSIDADHVSGALVKATNYGETMLDTNSEMVKLTIFGEMDISCARTTDIRRGIVLGEYNVNRW